MKLSKKSAPFFRMTTGVRDIMLSQLLACCALLCAAVALHGIRALVSAFFGVLGGALVELGWMFTSERLKGKDLSVVDKLTSPVTGLLCALMLPANASVWLAFAAAVFAVAVARVPFGGELGRSPFCGAAAGVCFATLCGATLMRTVNSAKLPSAERAIYEQLPDKVFAYIKGYHSVFSSPRPLQDHLVDYLSPNMLLRAGTDPQLSAGRLLSGNYNGGMGVTLGLLVIACAVWLILRGAMAWEAAAAYCCAVTVLSFLFPWSALSRPMSVVYDLIGGMTLFTAVFLCGDIFTAPHLRSARTAYGLCCGALAMWLRRRGVVEGGEVFAVLIMNALSDPADRLAWRMRSEGFSLGGYLRAKREKIRKKLRIGMTPLDELDAMEAERRGRQGDLSGFGRNAGDDDEKI